MSLAANARQRLGISLSDPTIADQIADILDVASVLGTSEVTSDIRTAISNSSEVASLTFAAAAAAANVCEVTITAKNAAGETVAAPFIADVWLSDAATGTGLTATTTSGTVTAKAASGIVLSTYTAKKAIRVQSLATGIFVLEITDTAKTGFYVCATAPGNGIPQIGTQLVAGNYG